MTSEGTPGSATAEAGEAFDDAARLRRIEDGLFFIVGCGRSGTTLLQSMLCCNPAVAIPRETKFYGRYGSVLRKGLDPARADRFGRLVKEVWRDATSKGVPFELDTFRRYAEAADRTWDGVFLALLAAFADGAGAERVGEKSPVHTRFLSRLAVAFPRARFVHLLRDPRAVVLSRMKAGFEGGEICPAIGRWREAARIHMKRADQVEAERYVAVRYEDLVTAPEQELRELCAFLQIELLPEMLRHHEQRRHPTVLDGKAHHANLGRPVFSDSIEKWRRELTRSQLGLIEASLRAEMDALGYEPVGASAPGVALRVGLSSARWKAAQGAALVGRGVRKLARRGRPAPSAADAAP